MKRGLTVVLVVVLAVALLGVPVSAQTDTTTTETANATEEEPQETFTAVDPSTRIVDYTIDDGGVMTLKIESDIPRAATVIGLVAGSPGVSELSFKKVQLTRGVNEVKLQTREVNGKRGVAVAVGNNAVTVVEKTSVSLFDEQANWDGVRSGFITGIFVSFLTIVVFGYRKTKNVDEEPKRVL